MLVFEGNFGDVVWELRRLFGMLKDFFQKLKKYELIEHKRNQKKQKMEEFKKSKHFEALLRGQKNPKSGSFSGHP